MTVARRPPQVLVNRFQQETFRPALVGILTVITALAKVLVPFGQWDDMIQTIINAASSPSALQREVRARASRRASSRLATDARDAQMSMFAFFSLMELDTVCDHLKPHFPALAALFSARMAPSEDINVRRCRGRRGSPPAGRPRRPRDRSPCAAVGVR